jgi:(1->4)-alpha-D-glucan 1-alpha-D-glucosylmutase
MEKATREAKLQTSWTEQNADYEQATSRFVESVLRNDAFRASLAKFVENVAFFGVFNSLSQLLLKAASPGVPDFYQGAELWDFSLVDPDNRRPVDYKARQSMLERVRQRAGANGRSEYVRELLAGPESGEVKMFVTWTVLQARRKSKSLFENGAYRPVQIRGSKRDHAVAFARDWEKQSMIVVAPRLPLTLAGSERKPPLGAGVWADTQLDLPDFRGFVDAFTRRAIDSTRLADVLGEFPIALLESR